MVINVSIWAFNAVYVFGSHEGILVHMEDCVYVMHAPILTHCLTTAVVA